MREGEREKRAESDGFDAIGQAMMTTFENRLDTKLTGCLEVYKECEYLPFILGSIQDTYIIYT